jgi:LDH2 family malate/lactate/ureidoglycolate dehydrogenase
MTASIVSGHELKRFITDVFGRVGMSPAHAGVMADTLVWANLRGIDSHGVVRLPRYLEMIDENLMNLRPEPKISHPAPVSIVIEADRAPGPVILSHAVEQLIEHAGQTGMAMALISRMTHSGALGYYTEKGAKAGLACIAVNAGVLASMPYHGARGAVLGTNPISVAVPGGGDAPLLFDMATSAISMGRLTAARRAGVPLDPGWAADEEGVPTTDPKAASMVLPLGGPKGSGLALMIECLASLLGGHPLIADALQTTGEGSRHRQNALLIAIDVARFVDPAEFRAQVQRTVDALKALPRVPGCDEILMPGERGYRTMQRRSEKGIPLPPPVVADLSAIAVRLQVSPLAMLG